MEEAGVACWLGKGWEELVWRASCLIHVRHAGLGVRRVRPGCLPRALASPPPGSVHRMFSGQTQATASPLTWPHIQPQRCLPMCGLGGVTCPRIKRGPLHRRCNAKTKPRPTHPLVRRAITPKHARRQSSPGWFAGSTNRAVPTNPETPSMKPFLARIVCLFRHIFSRKPLPLSHKRSDAGFGPPRDDGHRPMGRDHGARLRSRSRCRRSLTAIVNSDLFMTPYPG